MRVLYVIDSLAPGGAETSLAELAPGLVARGVELHVLPLGTARDLAPRLEEAGAVLHEPAVRGGRVANVRSVLNVIREIKPDLVHTTLYEADIAGRVAARIARVPSSTSLVNDSYDASHWREAPKLKLLGAWAVDSATARFATSFHSVTLAIAESLPQRLAVDKRRVKVIPRGRDPQRFPFRAAELRERTRESLGLLPTSEVILGVGRLEPQKGFHHLIGAVNELVGTHPEVVVLIAGREGRASEALRSLASRASADIRFLGQRTDVPALLAAADVFCLSSDREGIAGVLIEALAAGCPIVATAVPGALEVLGENGAIATVVPIGDEKAIARALAATLDEPSSARVERGRSRFESEYTIEGIATRMVSFFEEAARGT